MNVYLNKTGYSKYYRGEEYWPYLLHTWKGTLSISSASCIVYWVYSEICTSGADPKLKECSLIFHCYRSMVLYLL